jgi:hypothetical protein
VDLLAQIQSTAGKERYYSGWGRRRFYDRRTASDIFRFAAGDSGQTATTIVVTADFAKCSVGTGDVIDHTSTLLIGGSIGTTTTTQASINQSTGIARFDGRIPVASNRCPRSDGERLYATVLASRIRVTIALVQAHHKKICS